MRGEQSEESARISADRSAVEKLARKHRAALLRYFQRKGFQPPDDQDAVQEVFIRLVRREGLAHDVDRLEPYLFSTAGNVATDLYRMGKSRAADRQEVYQENLHAPADHDPSEILEGREAVQVLMKALKELPDRTRTIFVLARLEHMRQPEIARRLGVSLNTVEKHLRSAIGYLGERIGRVR